MDDDLDLNDDLDGDDPDAGSADADGSATPPADGDPKGGDGKQAKRINDLMSNWQREKARADRLEAELKGKAGAGAGDDQAAIPPEVRQWMNAAKDAARDRYYNSDPRFAEYGIDMSAIDGDTPEAMQASTKRIKALIDAVETKARAKVLDEHGLVPESVGGTPAPKVDYGSMSEAEFEKHVARVTGRSF